MNEAGTGAIQDSAGRLSLARDLAERARWRPQLLESIVSRMTPAAALLAYELSVRGRPVVRAGWTEIGEPAPQSESVRDQSPALEDWKSDTGLINRMRQVLEASQVRDPASAGTTSDVPGLIGERSAAGASSPPGGGSDLAQVIMNLPPPMAAAAVSAGVFSRPHSQQSAALALRVATDAALRSASIQRAAPSSADEPVGLSERPNGAERPVDVIDDQALDRLANEVYGRLRWRLVGEAERLMQ